MASGMAESASCVVPLVPPPAPTAADCCPPSPRLAVRAAGPPPPAVAAAPSPATAQLGHDATPALTAAVGAFLSAVVAPPLPTQRLELFGRRADDRAAVRAEVAGRYASPEAEATLRVDTELELLRRRCFAERNARWQFATPDAFAWTPVADAPWTPRPANDKLALRDLAADLDRAAAIGVPPPRDGGGAGATLGGFPLGEFVRDRPWPPKEFALKPAAKPRGRGGKRKAAAAALLPPPPLLAKMCVDCHTQSTPLWRSRVVVHPAAAAAVVQPVVNAVDATGVAVVMPEPAPVKQQELDLCLTCYLKTERRDLMDRKKAELARRAREKVAVAAAEKKRQQHQAQQLKKQKQQALKSRQRDAMAALAGPTSASSLALVESNGMVDEGERNGVILKFTRQEVEAAMDKKAVKKERRRSHHRDKKKKKKKKRSHEKLHHPEESESDGLTPLPSPPQMAAYEYADIKHEVDSMEAPQSPVTHEETASIATLTSPVSRSSKKPVRDEKGKFVSSSSSSSKKRKSEASVVETPVATKSGRSSRAKSSSAATPAAPAPAPTPTASSGGRKRARTKKKESSRERELRALGQYCPVCNEVYEDDDESSFVCCDSCEMWVHVACDASLTPYVS